MDMEERCAQCGEGCVKDGEQWKRCAELTDDDWLELVAAGLLFTDLLEDMFF
ncbi:MAG: hypothetical protein LN417_06665 [Candidatus Thermoplasmatota archaeon]|nr:hypothetical protein [Candidatus Thermoplasmatota archaeon]